MKQKFLFGVMLLAVVVFLGACGGEPDIAREEQKSEELDEEMQEGVTEVKEAVCLVYGRREPLRLYADRENGSFFSLTPPEGKIYDKEGKEITEEEIPNGAVVEIKGDGIMLESSPGQYPGVTQIRITGEEDAEKVQAYLEDINENFYQVPDPAERPDMQIEYRNSMAAVSTSAQAPGSYDWTYKDYEDKEHHIEEDAGPVSKWQDLPIFEVPGEVDAPGYELTFSDLPDEVEAAVYREDGGEPETVSIRQKDGAYYIEEIEPDAVYEITARWTTNDYFSGWAVYGFRSTGK